MTHNPTPTIEEMVEEIMKSISDCPCDECREKTEHRITAILTTIDQNARLEERKNYEQRDTQLLDTLIFVFRDIQSYANGEGEIGTLALQGTTLINEALSNPTTK